MFRKPHLVFSDTEVSGVYQLFYLPFTDVILTPDSYERDLGKKHVRFNGYMEMCYLHPNYFVPEATVIKQLGVKKDEVYSLVRFVDWKAVHDIGLSGLTDDNKRVIVNRLLQYGPVFISSECSLPDDLEPYRLHLPSEVMHSVMYFSSLLVAESATMSSEAAVMGTPAVFIDPVGRGYTRDQEKSYGMVTGCRPKERDKILRSIDRILKDREYRKQQQQKSNPIILEKIDVTAFMVELIETYHDRHHCVKKWRSVIL